jgi:hypothetical protein
MPKGIERSSDGDGSPAKPIEFDKTTFPEPVFRAQKRVL